MSELTLIIGNKNYSSWSLRPWFFLKQNNIKFKEKRVPLFSENTHKELLSSGLDGYGIALNSTSSTYVQTVLNQSYIKQWIEAGKLENEIIELDEA